MKSIPVVCAFSTFLCMGISAQPSDPQPIYRVTVVSRSLQAVNYEHRGGPTKIDFQGTVLLPHAKGEATVESKRGRVAIDAKFDHLEPPTKYGTEYLTYVLWAITPEGRTRNLGEILVDSSNKAHIDVTADMQAFGLLVTAEPYYSVTMPSDVVVMENVVRPDTIGMREQVTARYDLLPRGGYVMNLQRGQLRSVGSDAAALPYDRYEALLELYQAENAVQIARSLDADRYAPESFSKAESLLESARSYQARKQDTHMIVSTAREAAQMAEDARVIAVKRRDEDRVKQRQQAQQEDQARLRADRDAELARAQAAAEQADADRAAARRAQIETEREREYAAAQAQAAPAPAPRNAPLVGTPVPRAEHELTASQRQARAELYQRLNSMLATRDTPRGLIVTVPDSVFEGKGNVLHPAGTERLMRIAPMLNGLVVRVEGYTDDHGTDAECEGISHQRAVLVRDVLVRNGLAPGAAIATGFGKARPIASNATVAGREQNRRVEIIVSGPSIGEMPLWDRTYPLNSSQR